MDLTALSLTPEQAIFWLRTLALLAVVHQSLQLLGAREVWAERGLLSGKVLRSYRRFTAVGSVAGVTDPLFETRGFTALLIVRLLAAMAGLAVPYSAVVQALVILVVAATSALLMIRLCVGTSGGDQMCFILFGALCCRVLGSNSAPVTDACLWFVAIQACLAYFGAGIAKLRSPVWRSGEAIQRVVESRLWGEPRLAALLRLRPGLYRWLAWATFLPECLFPLILLAGRPLGYLFLLWGALLHLSIAAVMGVNVFPLPFFATYPALLYVLQLAGPQMELR